MREEERFGGFLALKNMGKHTKGDFGTSRFPIHVVEHETFKEQLWRTLRTVLVAFLWLSGLGAIAEDKGIGKGITMSL